MDWSDDQQTEDITGGLETWLNDSKYDWQADWSHDWNIEDMIDRL